MNSNEQSTVLVTGGTGFLGAHCILALLNQGYLVRTTLRTMNRQNEVVEMLTNAGQPPAGRLTFMEADLSKDANWDEAVRGCTYVLHVASPIALDVPKDENEMIAPAVNGTLRVLRAAKQAGVKRVVVTSSFAAIGYSHHDPNAVITEESWTNPNDEGQSTYVKSKTLAEKAAWDFIAGEGAGLELSVVNPAAIFGPTLGADLSGAFQILKQLFDGKLKAIPKISFGIVDVRDVADLHLRAMIEPKAKGQRFLALAGNDMSLPEIARLLKQKYGATAQNVATRTLPDFVVRIASLFSPAAKGIASQLGKIKRASNAKAKSILGWTPRSNEEAIFASVDSLLKIGAIQRR